MNFYPISDTLVIFVTPVTIVTLVTLAALVSPVSPITPVTLVTLVSLVFYVLCPMSLSSILCPVSSLSLCVLSPCIPGLLCPMSYVAPCLLCGSPTSMCSLCLFVPPYSTSLCIPLLSLPSCSAVPIFASLCLPMSPGTFLLLPVPLYLSLCLFVLLFSLSASLSIPVPPVFSVVIYLFSTLLRDNHFLILYKLLKRSPAIPCLILSSFISL